MLIVVHRLFTVYLQFAGHTCGIEDLTLTAPADEERRQLIRQARVDGEIAAAQWVGASDIVDAIGDKKRLLTEEEKEEVARALKQK